MTDVQPEQDERVVSGICRVTYIGSTGIEWICINKPHAKIYQRHHSSQNGRWSSPIFSNNPGVDRHYFINRWPNRAQANDVQSE